MPIVLALALALAAAAEAESAPAAPSALAVAPLPGQPNLLALGVPEIPPVLAARLDQYQNARAAGLFDVAADGKALLVGTRFASTVQLHLVTQPLGMREQLTFGKEPVRDARFAPGDPRTIYYLQDVGGGEAYQLYRLDRRTGRAELLTDGKSRHEGLVVSLDGRRLAWAGTARNGKDTDVYVAEAARPKEARRVTEAAGTFYPLDFSPDGARLLVMQVRSIADADLLLVDVATGKSRPLLAGKGSVRDAAFSADGRAAYVVTDRYGDLNALHRVELGAGGPPVAPRAVAPGLSTDVERLAVARDGRVALLSNADGFSLLHLRDPRSGRLSAAALPRGVASEVRFPSGRSDRLAVALSPPASPLDVHVLDLRTGKAEPWTRSEVGGLDRSTFAT